MSFPNVSPLVQATERMGVAILEQLRDIHAELRTIADLLRKEQNSRDLPE